MSNSQEVYGPDEPTPAELRAMIWDRLRPRINVEFDTEAWMAWADETHSLLITSRIGSNIGMGDATPRNRSERRKALKKRRLLK